MLARRILVSCALAAVACGRAPRDPVDALLADLRAAVADRDAEAIGVRLAGAFRGQGSLSRTAAIDAVRRHFFGYERVTAEFFDVTRDGQARVSFRVDLTGKPKDVGGLAALLPSSAVYRFELDLVHEDGALKVAGATWQEWRPDP